MTINSRTPMMEQYLNIRKTLSSDTLLFFRLGDFYELFLDDAKVSSDILGIALTKRHGIPMSGLPHHCINNYIPKLLKEGKKVAICDQVGIPQKGQLVKRKITKIITPGTNLEDSAFIDNHNQYILSLNYDKNAIQMGWIDISTGNFKICTTKNPLISLDIITAINPKEIILPEEYMMKWKNIKKLEEWIPLFEKFLKNFPLITTLADCNFDIINGSKNIIRILNVFNLEGFGINNNHPALGCGGALIEYISNYLFCNIKIIKDINEYAINKALLMDRCTQKNLEIFQTLDNTKEGSLKNAINNTVTAGGSRLLENYLIEPSTDLKEIKRRQKFIGIGISDYFFRTKIKDLLKYVGDVDRIMGRFHNKIYSPRDLGIIRNTLRSMPLIKEELFKIDDPDVFKLNQKIHEYSSITVVLDEALEEMLPSKFKEGNIFKEGYDKILDELYFETEKYVDAIKEYEISEKKRTKIKSLKIKYNNTFGYFIEITKTNIDLVPENYQRKQTLSNVERYITEELIYYEKEMNYIKQELNQREKHLFHNLVNRFLSKSNNIEISYQALSELDLFIGWSELAIKWEYCCPEVTDGNELIIIEGRHPVVEQQINKREDGLAGSRYFVANDTYLSNDTHQIMLITGPNMSGKSTYMRQIAIIALLAQIGCWVPAKKCKIGLLDRIFTRLGANDEIAKGNSTFMVEMMETSNILRQCTAKSLVILDEIGRGTGHFDGLGLAWSIMEYLNKNDQNKTPKTIFATHYQELIYIEKYFPKIHNYSFVIYKDKKKNFIFIRKIIKIYSNRSHGVDMARLAGLPEVILERASQILSFLDKNKKEILKTKSRNKNYWNREKLEKEMIEKFRKSFHEKMQKNGKLMCRAKPENNKTKIK